MSELLPSGQVTSLREGLVDYLAHDVRARGRGRRRRAGGVPRRPRERHLQGPVPPAAAAVQAGRRRVARRARLGSEGFTPYGHQAEAFERLTSMGLERGSAAAAADPGDDRHRIGQDRGVPVPDHRPRAARQARGRHRHEGAHPVSDERPRQRPGAAPRDAHQHPGRAGRHHGCALHRARRARSGPRCRATA